MRQTQRECVPYTTARCICETSQNAKACGLHFWESTAWVLALGQKSRGIVVVDWLLFQL